MALDDLRHVDAGEVGHLEIDDGQVHVVAAQLVLHLARIGEGADAVAFLLQDALDQISGVLVVIDDECADVHASPFQLHCTGPEGWTST